MNGTNTGTSGADVLSLGKIPVSAYPALIDLLESLKHQLTDVVNGDALPVSLDYVGKGGSDLVGDQVMGEICRRLVATVEKGNESNLILSVAEPEDHTKAWQPIDPATGIPLGQYKVWSTEQQKWVVSTPGDEDAITLPQEYFNTLESAPGASLLNFDFPDFKTTNFSVTATPTTKGSGGFLPPPDTIPNGFGYFVTNKSNAQITIAFRGIPNIGTEDDPVGVTWEILVRENQTA